MEKCQRRNSRRIFRQRIKIKTWKNVYLNDNKIISNIDGKFVTNQDRSGEIYIDVLDEHKITGNIDYSTGNIRFQENYI